MQCEIHQKEMKEGKFGPYCATPVRKSDDGQTVLEWCQFGQKPKSAKSNAQSDALVTIIKKLDGIETRLDGMADYLKRSNLVVAEPVKPSDKPVPF